MVNSSSVTFQKRLMNFFHYYSILIGMTSYRFDYATCTYNTTRGTQCAALIANAVTVVLLPLVIWDMLHIVVNHELMNSLMLLTNYVNFCVRGLAILYTVLYRYRREKQQKRISLALMHLDNVYLQKLPRNAAVERLLERIFYWRYVVTVCLWLSALLSYFVTPHVRRVRTFVLMFLYSHAVNMLHVTMFSYFLTMFFVYRAVSYANQHLYDMQQQLQALAKRGSRSLEGSAAVRQLMAEIDKDILEAHQALWQILGIVKQLNSVYRFQMLALRFSNFSSNIVLCYYGAVFVFKGSATIAIIAYGLFTYTAMMLDLYLVDLVCDMAVQACKETTDALKYYSELPFHCVRLLQTCETFALFLSNSKLQADLCGLFFVNKRLWFQMSVAVFSFTIVLVQFHIVVNSSEARNTSVA